MEEKTATWARPYLIILATVVLLRLFTLGVPALIDTTEGRYATTSQLMLEKDDWVTPWIIYRGEEKPYLGKPPLHFWLINTSYEIFGLSNFSARLPSLLSALAIGLSLFCLTNTLFGRRAAFVSALVFGTSLLTFFLGGACLLDVTLTVGITVAIAGFALSARSPLQGYLCFVGLGLGVLVKGPVALVFFGMATGPWVAMRWWLTRSWPKQLTSLPWISGTALFLAICIPWYILAEIRNPGFLHYFIWTENIGRFFSETYGDEYGSGHQQIRGAAWVMMIPSLIPWSVALVATLIEQRRHISYRGFFTSLKNDEWLLLGFLWTISCPLLLIFARQYTLTYIFSSIPGFAFLTAMLWKKAYESDSSQLLPSRCSARWMSGLMALTVIISAVAFYLRAPSTPGLVIAIAIGCVILGFALKTPKMSDPLSSLGFISLMTAIGYTGTIVGANSHLSTHRSTQNILNYAATFVKEESVTIGFAHNLPFSARFYSSLMSHPRVKVSQVDRNEIAEAPEELIIVRKNKGDEDIVKPVSTREKIGELGRWRIYRRTSTIPNQ